MTREEAINFGKMWLDINSDDKDNLTYEFFEQALEAFKAKPKYLYDAETEKYVILSCEDCKSVSDIEKLILTKFPMAVGVLDQIRKLPSVQPTRAKGKWIKHKIGYGCSNCTLCTNDYGVGIYKYCPNCGCQMEGGE